MAYSKNELGTINTLYFPKKKFHITPLPLHNGHLCTTATFFVLSPGKETSYTDLTLSFFPWSWEIWIRDYRQGGRLAVVERFDCTCWNKGTLFWEVLRRKIDRSGIILSAVPSRTSKSRLQLLHFAALVACLCGGQVREASTPRVELRGHSPLFVSEIVPRV